MNLPSDKAEAILDLCLSNESIQMKTKVYEILNLSGIKPNDSMFLVLALTGQMRVFLETAPKELGELLEVWKSHSSKSIAKLIEAIEQVEASQKKQRETIKQTIEEINSQGVDNIRAINKALIAEILSSNTRVELKVKALIDELTQIQSKIDLERKNNIQLMQSLIEGISQTYSDLDQINWQIQSSISSLERLKIYLSKRWIIVTVVVFAGFFILFGSSITLAILGRQKSQQSSSLENKIERCYCSD